MLRKSPRKHRIGPKSVVNRFLLADHRKRCSCHSKKSVRSCQSHANLQWNPVVLMKAIISPCPFDQWDLDIVGPFPQATWHRIFLLVAVNYFSKSVKVEPLARITWEWSPKLFLEKHRLPIWYTPETHLRQWKTILWVKVQAWCWEIKIEQIFTSVMQHISRSY